MGRTKTREITIKQSKGSFSIFKKSGGPKDKYDFEGIASLRQLLSNEKAKILDVIKNEKPKSIYELSKKLERNFKSVAEEVHLLERFGFIELIDEKTKNRKRYKPEIIVDNLIINIKI